MCTFLSVLNSLMHYIYIETQHRNSKPETRNNELITHIHKETIEYKFANITFSFIPSVSHGNSIPWWHPCIDNSTRPRSGMYSVNYNCHSIWVPFIAVWKYKRLFYWSNRKYTAGCPDIIQTLNGTHCLKPSARLREPMPPMSECWWVIQKNEGNRKDQSMERLLTTN